VTGPEHYKKAADLLDSVDGSDWDVTDPEHRAIVGQMVSEARGHAALAQVAAIAEAGGLTVIGKTEMPTNWARAFEGASL
jgi:hypothetical protein